MKITIEDLNPGNIKDVNKCDNEFIIDSKLQLQLNNEQLGYTIIELPVTSKRYGVDDFDYVSYLDNIHKAIFLAYVEDQIAGQIILRRNWNKYAYIEDICVDTRFRRHGIGRALISHAKQWAQNRGLMGVMLETQDNNVPACTFYAACGFQLRGFDSYLYKGLNRATDEIALYWYLYFE